MSSFALKGFVTGLAKGVATGLDEERESTRKNLAFQMKSSYENMQKYNESVAAMKKDIMERDQRLLQFDPSLTQEQRIAAATMPDLLNVYQNLLNQGTKVRLGDLITVGERAKGGNFNTWVSNLGQLEKAADTTGFVVDKKDSFFAPSATAQQRMVAEMSSALGADAQQLARFKTTPDLPSLGSYGAFAPQFLDKLVKQKTIGEQLTDVRGRYAQVAAEKGEDSQEAKDLFDLNKKLTDYKTNLEPKEATWASRMDALRIKYADAKLAGKTGEMSEIEKQMNAHLEAYKKSQPVTEKDAQESLASFRGLVRDSVAFAIRQRHGDLWQQKKITQTDQGEIVFGGLDQNIQRDVQVTEQLATINALSAWIVGGKPINDRVAAVLRSRGIGLDSEGKIIIPSREEQPRSQQSPSPQRAAPVAPVPAPQSQVPTNPITEKAGPATPRVSGLDANPNTWTEEKGFRRNPDMSWAEPMIDEKTGRVMVHPKTGKPRYLPFVQNSSQKGTGTNNVTLNIDQVMAYAKEKGIDLVEAFRQLARVGYGFDGS